MARVIILDATHDLETEVAKIDPDLRVSTKHPRTTDTKEIVKQQPDVIIIGGQEGNFANTLDWCRRLKNEPVLYNVPVIVIGSRGEEASGFAAGADDYVEVRAAPAVVAARVNNLLHQRSLGIAAAQAGYDQRTVRIGPLTISPAGYSVTTDGKPIDLTVGEFRLLWKLARNVGRFVSPRDLAETDAHSGEAPTDASIRSRVFCLRKKLGPHGQMIESKRNAGYRIVG